MKSSHVLRAAIREILMENYNVSITAVPISTKEKYKRGQKPTTKMANLIMTQQDLEDLLGKAEERDVELKGYAEEDQELLRRIGEISDRISPSAAKMARAILSQMSDRKSTRLNSSHVSESRMPSSA